MIQLAYIDPGSGSMLIQMVLAAILTVPFIFRTAIGNAWRRLRGQDRAEAVHSEADGPSPKP